MRQVIHKRGYVSKQSSKHTLTIDTEKRVKKGDRQYCTSCVCGHCENVFQNGEYSLLQADGRNYCATCTCGVCTKPLKGREKGFCKDCTCTSCDKALSQSKGYIKHKYVLLRHLKEHSNHIIAVSINIVWIVSALVVMTHCQALRRLLSAARSVLALSAPDLLLSSRMPLAWAVERVCSCKYSAEND